MKFVLLVSLFYSIQLSSQDLADYKWKNRIVLIISNNADSETFKNQISILDYDLEGLKERRLLVFKVLPSKYQLDSETWRDNSELYNAFNPKNKVFKLVLLGLDGGVKLNQNTFASKEQLFALIDGMPMRSAELRNKN